ncbi:hypothetical protein [uncultured Sphingomonas sp.]|uniref:hypothetical protein n=1 Tax=uncultured Sphingomonas sp. TaxID=158754 RepID=UPI0035CB5626
MAMRGKLLAGLVMTLTPAIAGAQMNTLVKPDGSPHAQEMTDAYQAILERQPARAVELITSVIADFEKSYAGEKRQIFCAVSEAQSAAYLTAAKAANREAVAIEPGWCRAQYINAFALVDLGKLDEAGAAFERLLTFAPRNSRYLNELGYVYQAQKKWDLSLDAYRRSEIAADLAPDDVVKERCVALRGQGYDLVELGQLNYAEAAYRRCLAIAPDDKNSRNELLYIEQQRKKTI